MSAESSSGDEDLVARGSGTDGGFVVHRSAAKYKHNAGPDIMRSASADARTWSSISLSTFACVREDLR